VVTLIKNGFLYDGNEKVPQEADILISGRKIARVGKITSKRHIDHVLNAQGKVVVPGFIDVHTRPDFFSSLFEEHSGETYLCRGITTIIGGNCGVSLAPFLHPSQLETAFKNRWHLNVHWDSVESFFSILERRGIEINFGTLVGYSGLADGITQGARRDLSEKEREASNALLDRSLAAGAGGVSVPLCSPDKRDIPTVEMEAILSLCKKRKKMVAVCVEEQEKCSTRLKGFLNLARKKRVRVRVSHIEPKTKEEEKTLNLVLNLQEKESTISCDLTPGNLKLIPLVHLLPEHWQTSSLEEIQELLFSSHGEDEIEKHIRQRINKEQGIRIARILDPSLKFLEGRTLREFSNNRGETFEEAIIALMRLTRLEAAIVVDDINQQLVEEEIWKREKVLVSPFMEDQNGFAQFLRRTMEKGIFGKIIAQTTSLPALFHGIAKRGLIKEGYFADILILDKDYIPEHILVNGKIVKSESRFIPEHAGMALRLH